MRIALFRFLYVALIFSYSIRPAAAEEQETGTIKGPETTGLAGNVYGHIVMWEEAGITALELPNCKQQIVVPPFTDATASVHAISGPDADGRLAYVEDHRCENDQDNQHLLKTIKRDGTQETVVFTHKGSALWATTAAGHGEIGTHLALAPVGGRVALLQHLKDKQMPAALLNTGELEIITLADKVSHATHLFALDEPMSWFPDGKRLAYSRLVSRNKLSKTVPGIEQFGSYFDNEWTEIPAIYVLEVATGNDELLCVGWQPVISGDGETAFIGGWGKKGFQWVRLDLKTKALEQVSPPGLAAGVIAAPSRELLIYVGLPTTGTSIKQMKSFSPLRGPRPLQTVKIANIGNGKFQTIVPYADPRFAISFGQTAAQRDRKTETSVEQSK